MTSEVIIDEDSKQMHPNGFEFEPVIQNDENRNSLEEGEKGHNSDSD